MANSKEIHKKATLFSAVVAEYTSCGVVSSLEVFGIKIYLRIGNVRAICGLLFHGYRFKGIQNGS